MKRWTRTAAASVSLIGVMWISINGTATSIHDTSSYTVHANAARSLDLFVLSNASTVSSTDATLELARIGPARQVTSASLTERNSTFVQQTISNDDECDEGVLYSNLEHEATVLEFTHGNDIAADDLELVAAEDVSEITFSIIHFAGSHLQDAEITLYFWELEFDNGELQEPNTDSGNELFSETVSLMDLDVENLLPLAAGIPSHWTISTDESFFTVPDSKRIWAGLIIDQADFEGAGNEDDVGQVIASKNAQCGQSNDERFWLEGVGLAYFGQGNSANLVWDLRSAPGACCVELDCQPDVSGQIGLPDGTVDIFDLLYLIGEWGPCADPDECQADISGPDGESDGVVDIFDLLLVISEWGPCAQPCSILTASECAGAGGAFAGTGTDCDELTCLDCGTPAAGDCCESHGMPNCDDDDCCEQVCAQPAFAYCCEEGESWDEDCVTEAQDLCDVCADPDPEQCGSEETGDCCEANGTPFCNDEDCCEFVCLADPFCCDTEWDGLCAEQAHEHCEMCFTCGSEGAGDCCEANDTPYCNDEDCCEFVCLADPFCCDTEWDGLCAEQAQDHCEMCFACGSVDAGDCCEANDTPYCNDEDCCELVCADDPFCCDTEWGPLCAEVAQELCAPCFECGHDLAGSCCEANESPSCDDEECCELVCAIDAFCCSGEWDELCASDAQNFCEPCFECGSGAAGDCCDANDTPYCEDEACCDLICGQDPFCCNIEWDSLCAEAAHEQCAQCR